MLLSKLNSVGAIFISWPEAADVIRRIARRESVAKGRERFTLPSPTDQPSAPSLSLFPSCPPSPYRSPVALHARRVASRLLYTYALCLLSPHILTDPFIPHAGLFLFPSLLLSSLLLPSEICTPRYFVRCAKTRTILETAIVIC